MTVSLRLLAAGLLLAVPLAASATSGEGSDLDRLSATHAILPQAAPDDATPLDEAACGPGSAPCPPPDASPVPLDGGLSLLALAGAGLAAKRLRARRA